MSVTISVATSKDGYIDDNSPERLLLSSPEDWEAVYALRAASDAILIGGETLRRDNPRLRIKREELIADRVAKGMTPEPARIVVSGRGAISPSLRLFDGDGGRIIIFSNIPRPELDGVAEVVVMEQITAIAVVEALERRSICNLFVEGGAKIIEMFFREEMVDILRVACNPAVVVDDSEAPRLTLPSALEAIVPHVADLGGVEVREYHIREVNSNVDYERLSRAVELSRSCTPSATSYCVGAVVVTSDGAIFEGYTGQTAPTHHAEQAAIFHAEQAGANLCGATMYSSMEPCSKRSSEKESCSEIMIRLGFARAVFALYEPNHFVCCEGAANMRRAGIAVSVRVDLAQAVLDVNSHLW